MAIIIGKHNGLNDIILTEWEYGVKAYSGDVAVIDDRIWAIYDDGRNGHVRGWDITEQIGNNVLTKAILERQTDLLEYADIVATQDSFSRENA